MTKETHKSCVSILKPVLKPYPKANNSAEVGIIFFKQLHYIVLTLYIKLLYHIIISLYLKNIIFNI